jgi:hypothetical protein
MTEFTPIPVEEENSFTPIPVLDNDVEAKDDFIPIPVDAEDEPTAGEIVAGVGTEIGVGVGGQLAGAAIGTAILPGLGTAIGYGIGSLGSGIAGSIAAQKIEGQEDISWGRAIAAGLINLVPGGAAKGIKGAATLGKVAAREATKGAAMGATEATSRAIIDEGRLPTQEELTQYGGAGALFGGALGTVASKVGSKFAGKSASEIDEAIAKGEIDYKDLEFVAKQGQVKKPTATPKDTPEPTPAPKTPEVAPKFSEDIPSEDWLEGKIEDVIERGVNKYGVPRTGIVTGWFGSTLELPLNKTKGLKGANGEDVVGLNQNKVDELVKVLEDGGKLDVPLVGIHHDGTPYILEGNHRIAASQQAGIPIKVEVKYFDGGQRKAVEGWKPDQLKPTPAPKTPEVAPSPTLEGIIRPDIEQITARVQSENAAAELVKARSIAAKEQGTLGAILASIVPSKYVGAKANQATIDFKRSITEAEELGSRIADKVKREVGENADLNATINKVIDGDASVDISELPASVSSDIIKFQEMRLGLQNKMAQLLDDGAFNSLDDAAKDELMKTVQDSIAGKSYARREYQMFLNRDYKPTQAQYDAALAELSKSMGAAKAKKHMDALENASAARKSADPRGTFGAAVDGVLKRKHTVGKAEREWLGEVVDAPERMRGTLSGLARSVARAETDMVVANELLEAGLGSRTRTGNMVPLTLRGTGKDGTGVYVNPETQVALNQIYLPSADKGTENIFLKGIQDLYGASVAGSKASKVLLNTIAYPVQLYGNTANLIGMGINPFKGAGRGTQLALAEFGGIERLSKSPKARKAMLDDLQDMAKYGIKSANVLESDIRSGLKEGFFSKALGKVTDPLGKAYSVPDTMGRYVGWKANQNTIRKIFPQLNDEQVKRQAAIMINDTYQNYDKLSNTVRTLSRWGVMPQFASFTAEFMRNQYNQGKIIAQMAAGKYGQEFGLEASDAGVRAMRKEAAKRTASLLAVYGGTYGAIEGVKAASGVDQEKEEAIREAYPDWNKNRNLMVKLDKNGRTGWTANPSYVIPHSLGLSALKAGMSGQDQASLVGLLADEMIGEGSFVMQEAYRAISNQNRYGRPITNEPDDLKAAADKMKFFITELFKPGFSRELQKATKAARGKGDLTLREVGARQLGARLNPMDLNKDFKNKFMDLNELSKGATGEYKSLLRRDEATEGERQAAYQKANRISREVFNSFVRKDRAMKTLGFSDEERVKTMKEAKVGGKTILQILDNEYKDLSPVLAQTSTDIYEELPEGKSEKRKAILSIIRTKPEMGKRLLSMWKREQKQQRRGLSERELVFSKLGTEDKVSYLKKRPNLVIEYRRKGLLNESVLRALRQ